MINKTFCLGTTRNHVCLGDKEKHFVVVTSGFNDVFEENYCNFNIVFAASKKIWVSKTDWRDIPANFKNIWTSVWVNKRFVDVFFHSYNLKTAENCRGLGKRCKTTPYVWIWPHFKILKRRLFSFESIRSKTKVISAFFLVTFMLLISLEKIIIIIKDAS